MCVFWEFRSRVCKSKLIVQVEAVQEMKVRSYSSTFFILAKAKTFKIPILLCNSEL